MGATFPKILGGDSGLDIEITPEQIAMIGVLLVAIAFLYSAIVILISVFARDLKEASTISRRHTWCTGDRYDDHVYDKPGGHEGLSDSVL